MEIYLEILKMLEVYFDNEEWKKYFLRGGCYWFADYLHQRIKPSTIMINRQEEHCALYFSKGLYDVRGKISICGFHSATDREISFMKKNYIPKFDVIRLESYLEQMKA